MGELHVSELTDWMELRTLRIRAVSLHPDLFYDTPESARNHPPLHWQNLLEEPGNKFFCLYDGLQFVGFTGIVASKSDYTGQTAMIAFTFIEPEFRKKGLADLLYDVRLKHAANNRAWKKVVADHREGNEASRKAILRHGFMFTERVLIDWPDGSRDYELRYELDLEKLRSA